MIKWTVCRIKHLNTFPVLLLLCVDVTIQWLSLTWKIWTALVVGPFRGFPCSADNLRPFICGHWACISLWALLMCKSVSSNPCFVTTLKTNVLNFYPQCIINNFWCRWTCKSLMIMLVDVLFKLISKDVPGSRESTVQFSSVTAKTFSFNSSKYPLVFLIISLLPLKM